METDWKERLWAVIGEEGEGWEEIDERERNHFVYISISRSAQTVIRGVSLEAYTTSEMLQLYEAKFLRAIRKREVGKKEFATIRQQEGEALSVYAGRVLQCYRRAFLPTEGMEEEKQQLEKKFWEGIRWGNNDIGKNLRKLLREAAEERVLAGW